MGQGHCLALDDRFGSSVVSEWWGGLKHRDPRFPTRSVKEAKGRTSRRQLARNACGGRRDLWRAGSRDALGHTHGRRRGYGSDTLRAPRTLLVPVTGLQLL